MNFTTRQKQDIVKKVLENNFQTNEDLSLMFVDVDGQTIPLNDTELEYLLGYKGCTVKQRVTIAKGITAEEFYNNTGVFTGYKLFDLHQHPEYIENSYIEDKGNHGIYFTINKEELFRFIMTSYFEKFGGHIAEISLKHDSEFLKNVAIAKGYDTNGTYRTHCFYISKVYSTNDYKLILDLFNIAPEQFKILICDDSENGIYKNSIRYYHRLNCEQTVAALKYLHDNYHV